MLSASGCTGAAALSALNSMPSKPGWCPGPRGLCVCVEEFNAGPPALLFVRPGRIVDPLPWQPLPSRFASFEQSSAAVGREPWRSMASEVLTGVVAFVSINNDGGLNASAAFSKQLASAGAKIAPRLCKEVTHVVFKGPDDELRAMYDRVHKVRVGCGASYTRFRAARAFPLLIRSGRPEHRAGRRSVLFVIPIPHPVYASGNAAPVRPTPANNIVIGLTEGPHARCWLTQVASTSGLPPANVVNAAWVSRYERVFFPAALGPYCSPHARGCSGHRTKPTALGRSAQSTLRTK